MGALSVPEILHLCLEPPRFEHGAWCNGVRQSVADSKAAARPGLVYCQFSKALFDVIAWNKFQVWMRQVERLPQW